jgi:Uma2 family endonuclease
MSREMFRLWAPLQRGRYERVKGEPVAMSPERYAHATVKSRIWLALRTAIQAAGVDCVALPDGMTVEIDDGTDYEPDAAVHCGGSIAEDAIAIPNPVIVVEVLSPSTQAFDTGAKLADYFRIPSIQHYLVVRTRRQEVIHHRRVAGRIETRVFTSGSIVLDPPGLALSLTDFYND